MSGFQIKIFFALSLLKTNISSEISDYKENPKLKYYEEGIPKSEGWRSVQMESLKITEPPVKPMACC